MWFSDVEIIVNFCVRWNYFFCFLITSVTTINHVWRAAKKSEGENAKYDSQNQISLDFSKARRVRECIAAYDIITLCEWSVCKDLYVVVQITNVRRICFFRRGPVVSRDGYLSRNVFHVDFRARQRYVFRNS